MADIQASEGTGGSDLTKYIVDPEKDGVDAEFVDVDKTPELEGDPAEFKDPEGESETAKGGVKVEEDKKKVKETSSKHKKLKTKTVVTPEVAKAKKETKEEEAKRYKKILLDLGFSLKAGSEEGKAQYVLKIGDLGIGRTFQTSYPTGKFWARQNDEFLNTSDVKELDIVKEFYAVRDGKKSIKEAVVMTEPAPSGEVVPYKKPAEIKRQIGTMKLQKKGGYYPVGGHNEPDAWLVQQWGTEAGVTLQVIYAEQDDVCAKAIIRAQLGDLFVEAAVIHHFNTTKEVITLETIDIMERRHKHPIVGIDSEGHPLLSSDTLYEIYKRWIRFKNFAIRDAVTKASRIATLKILNQDWREPDEIESEAAEVRSVNSG